MDYQFNNHHQQITSTLLHFTNKPFFPIFKAKFLHMEFQIPFIFVFFVLSTVSCRRHDDELSPEVYWHKVLPNTPMPKAIINSLHSGWTDNKGKLSSPGTNVGVGRSGVSVQAGGTQAGVGKGGVRVHTGKHGSASTNVAVGRSGVRVQAGGTQVGVGKGGVGAHTGKPGTNVSVGKGGIGVQTGGTQVGVGKGGVVVNTGPKPKPGVDAFPFSYVYASAETQLDANPNTVLFFLDGDLTAGKKMTLQFPHSGDGAAFLRRHGAAVIPFSSATLSAVLRRFSIAPESNEAAMMKQTINECEQNHVVCATSLESMVDLAVSRLGGKTLTAVSTDAGADDGKRKTFNVTAVRELQGGDDVVACHKGRYPYAAFYCHVAKKTVVYKVELAAEGRVVEAAAVCHHDTAEWNPKHLAFQVLKVKPGSVPICHFLPENHIVWLQN